MAKTLDGWLTRRGLAWAGYDVASSVYAGLAPVLLLPMYFRGLMPGSPTATATWGMIAAIAVLASSLASLAAAAAVRRVSRFTLLACLSAGLVLSLAALAWNPGSSLLHAAVAFIAAQSFYFAATTLYESFLPDLLPEAARQKLSGFGWGLGYLGGIIAILVLLAFAAGKQQSVALLEDCFGLLAILSGIGFALVLDIMRRQGFASLREGTENPALADGLPRLAQHWPAVRRVLALLGGTLLVQMSTSVVMTFTAPLLAAHFGKNLQDLLWLLLIIHIISVPSTFAWSHAMSSGSRVAPMCLLLCAWALVLLLLAYGSGEWMPLITVFAIGGCLGATASALRGFLAESVKQGDSAVLFGLGTVAGRCAAALGPALFSGVTLMAGERAALLVIVLVLGLGGALVLFHLLREPTFRETIASPPAAA